MRQHHRPRRSPARRQPANPVRELETAEQIVQQFETLLDLARADLTSADATLKTVVWKIRGLVGTGDAARIIVVPKKPRRTRRARTR